MQELTDISIMPFGPHKGKEMKKVPATYLLPCSYDIENEKGGSPITINESRVLNYVRANKKRLLKETGQ